MQRLLLILAFICLGLGASAQTPVSLTLNPVAGSSPFVLNQDFNAHAGGVIFVSRLQYYLCNFRLVHDGGQETALAGIYLLVNSGRTNYDLDTINFSNIEKIRFAVGVDATVNHNDPSVYPSGHPLALQSPGMHWGWNAGYKFLAFEGEADADQNGEPETVWQLHPVGDQLLRNVEVTVTPTSTGNGLDIALDYDIQAWLRNMDLATVGIEHGSTGAAITVVNNINAHQVFRAAGTVGVVEAQPEAVSLYFNYAEPERPVAHYRVQDAHGRYTLRVSDLQGKMLFQADELAAEGKVRIEPKLGQGVYICTLLQGDMPLLSKKFQVLR